jgi:TonB family protein
MESVLANETEASVELVALPPELAVRVKAPRRVARAHPSAGRAWLASILLHVAVLVVCAVALPIYVAYPDAPMSDGTPCIVTTWAPVIELRGPQPLTAAEAEALLLTEIPEATPPEKTDEPVAPLASLRELNDSPEARNTPDAASDGDNLPRGVNAVAVPEHHESLEGWLVARVKAGTGSGGNGNGDGDGSGTGTGGSGAGIGLGGGGTGYGPGGNGWSGGKPGGPEVASRGTGRGASRHARPTEPLTPAYPERQRQAGRDATVLLLVHVDSAGKAGQMEVLSPDEDRDFVNAALAAARKTRYEPALEEGQAVAGVIRIRVEFRLR